MNFDWQTLMAVAVLGLMVLSVFRGGQKRGEDNSVGTTRLQTDMTKMAGRVDKIELRLDGIQHDLDGAPTKADLERLAGDVRTLSATMEGVRGHVESVDSAVVRIEMMLASLSPQPRTTRSRK